MNRLHPDTLGELAAGVAQPPCGRRAMRPGILHLGPGAFHRAHQAVFTEDAMAVSGGDWGIIGVSLRSPTVADQLTAQDGLYSVSSEDDSGSELRVVGVIQRVLVAPREPEAVVAAMADPAICIITLTITEKGYTLAPDGVSLDREDAVIQHDLANPERPASAVGMLALGLCARLAAGGAPLTLLSCDNLCNNSALLRAVLLDYLQTTFPQVVPWLEEHTAFPCSMVDRIVPAMTAERRKKQWDALGLVDEGAVSTEPFSQWVIEDNFAAGRPQWERAGVQMVHDIAPFEDIKLRLLNASHSSIAYFGLLAGQETVDQVMADPVLCSFIETLMAQDLMPALDVPAGFDLGAYRDQLLARFSNTRLRHRCDQIAMDGSEKIAQRWLPTLQWRTAPLLCKALAAWVHFVLDTEFVLDDPRSDRLLALRASAAVREQRVADTLACARITPQTVANYDALRAELERNLDTLAVVGVDGLLAA